jgi:hypothetical protein
VLAWIDYERSLCSGCGGYLPETTDPENESRYKAGLPHRCHRCDAVQSRQADYRDAKNPSALRIWPVELKK